ncbi:hypothetical protein H5410_031009 [Solanum commersonii]|uniref:Uncharacterized protein n=1 Tax=Solanum commersonii TaxID=4109 RepID=A0A9J5YIL4_SOLCO|nr:hypothetical protein H5410_031009 [Solanum commersonii]
MYVKPSRAQILSLKDSLTHVTKVTQSMSAYLQHIKQLVTNLNSTGVVIALDELTLYVLNGLPSEYKGLILDLIKAPLNKAVIAPMANNAIDRSSNIAICLVMYSSNVVNSKWPFLG